MKKFILVIMILLLTISTNVFSGLLLESYEQSKKDKTVKASNELYINALVTAYGWANTELKQRNKELLYCQPDNLALDQKNYVMILEDHIDLTSKLFKENNALKKEVSIEYLLLQGLIVAFPCNNK
jgi:hypothetical protein